MFASNERPSDGHRAFAFIKSGSFSHINARLREQLAAAFPEYVVEEIDLWDDIIRRDRASFLIGCLQAVAFYGRHVVANPRAVRFAALRSPFLFRRIRERIGHRLGHLGSSLRFTFQSQSLFDASVTGIPHFVFTDHTHLANLQYPAFRRADLYPTRWTDLERDIYAHAAHVFTMSEHVAASVHEDYGIAPSRISVVHSGSNIDPSPAPLNNAGYTNQTVVFVGVEWERKGGPTLVTAFRSLRTRQPNAKLIVVGCTPGVNESWCEEIGRIPRDSVKNHLLRGSVFCLPTRIEPFGVAVIEALSQSLPAVVSNIGAMPFLVRDGQTGRIVPVDDPAALAAALEELLLQPEKCRVFGEAGRRDMLERFSWAMVGEKLRRTIVARLAP